MYIVRKCTFLDDHLHQEQLRGRVSCDIHTKTAVETTVCDRSSGQIKFPIYIHKWATADGGSGVADTRGVQAIQYNI